MPRPLLATIAVMLVVLAIYFGVGSQLPDHWRVETTRVLEQPLAVLTPQFGDLQRWPKWCGMQVTLGAATVCEASGTPGSPDQRLTWRGSKGSVVLRLLRFDAAAGLDYEISMQREGGAPSTLGRGSITWSAAARGSRVQWVESGSFDSFPARWSGWFGAVQEHVRDNQEAGLGRLAQAPEASK